MFACYFQFISRNSPYNATERLTISWETMKALRKPFLLFVYSSFTYFNKYVRVFWVKVSLGWVLSCNYNPPPLPPSTVLHPCGLFFKIDLAAQSTTGCCSEQSYFKTSHARAQETRAQHKGKKVTVARRPVKRARSLHPRSHFRALACEVGGPCCRTASADVTCVTNITRWYH